MTQRRVLIVVTSHDHITEKQRTGLWLPEFSEPYALFVNEGFEVTVASIRGGSAPIDPRSAEQIDESGLRDALRRLEKTVPIRDVRAHGYDAIFLPGGHGTMYDLPESEELGGLLRSFDDAGRVIAAVCHGPAGFLAAASPDGAPLVKGRKVTGFTNEEERAAGFDTLMPFLLEDRLRELGATFVSAAMWSDHVVRDGNLITGQNPQSSASTATAVIAALR